MTRLVLDTSVPLSAIALALDADAEAIVTGDRDLLDVSGLRPPAIDARAACALLRLPES